MRKFVAALLAIPLAIAVAGCGRTPSSQPAASVTPTSALTVAPSSGVLSLVHLRMVSPTSAWALAMPGEGQGLSHLVRTIDGGAHWSAIGLPSDLMSPNLDAFDFHDELNAWVLIVLGAESTASHELAVVATTSDGGRHWATTPKFGIDGQGTTVQFLDAAHGWVFALPSAGGAVGAGDTTLYRTIDGGVHWQAIKPPSEARGDASVVAGLPEACPMGGPLGPPIFADALTGWLGAFCNQPVVYVTRDGGVSWARGTIPSFPGAPPAQGIGAPQYNVDSFQRMSATDAYLVVHRGFTTGANALQEAAIYVTHDAGTSWMPYRLPAAELGADFADPLHGWVIGAGPGGAVEARSLYATQDGGRTWRLVHGPADYFDRELSFADPLSGLIAIAVFKDHPPQLLRTTDGGVTWAQIAAVVD